MKVWCPTEKIRIVYYKNTDPYLKLFKAHITPTVPHDKDFILTLDIYRIDLTIVIYNDPPLCGIRNVRPCNGDM